MHRKPGDGAAGWKTVVIGLLIALTGVIGAVVAWFPPPPHSTTAPLVGWPARWFAGGVGLFGLVVTIVGLVAIRCPNPSIGRLRRVGRVAFVMALSCWFACAISLLWR